ncbi:MAG TPA: hypothetical protein VGF53_00780 [Pseudolabrys sp.]
MLLAWVGAGAILLSAALSFADDGASNNPPAAEPRGLFGNIGRWFDDQASSFGSHFKGARSGVENFGHEAGIAAKTTVEGAKDAAGAVTRIPAARVVGGHEKCTIAPNGAPDCVVAANAICKAKGFESGKSVDMTTAEVCTAKVYIAGRNSGEGCRTETFVSRALCQ